MMYIHKIKDQLLREFFRTKISPINNVLSFLKIR